MAEDLQGIAKKLGIATRFTDAGLSRRDYDVSPEIIKFFIRAFGYSANSEAEIAASLQEIELERWKHALEPVYVVQENDIGLDLVVYADFRSEPVTLELKAQDSGKKIPAACKCRQRHDDLFQIKNKNPYPASGRLLQCQS